MRRPATSPPVPKPVPLTWLPRVTDVGPDAGPQRTAFLGAPRPNPTATGSSVLFRIARPEYVRLSVVDIRGARVRTLSNGMMGAGDHTMRWDGRSAGNQPVAPGGYMFALTTSSGTITQRVSIVR